MAASQRDTLLMFTAMLLLRQTWAGSLLVSAGLSGAGRELALASLAAGAALIVIEDDAATLRAGQREGCCTFSVHSLDEALRIAKNEVRQGRAISVALRCHPALTLQEMVERGVQPEAFVASRPLSRHECDALDALIARGTRTLHGFGLPSVRVASLDLEQALRYAARGRWTLREQNAADMAERRLHDATMLRCATEKDAMAAIKKLWLERAPTLFPRALERCTWEPAEGEPSASTP